MIITSLAMNYIGDCISLIVDLIKESKENFKLDLSHINIDSSNLSYLLDALINIRVPVELDLGDNGMD